MNKLHHFLSAYLHRYRLGLGIIAVFSLPLLLYILTLAPTIYNLDSAELTTAAATLGLTRSTGYPFYILIGHLWSKIPVGDVGYRLNLFSAFNGALAITLAFLILRELEIGFVASFGAIGLLASGINFWGLSLIAEVYTLQVALMAALIFCLLRWQKAPTPRKMFMVGLLAGLGLCHHASQIFLLLAAGLFILFNSPASFRRKSGSPVRSALPRLSSRSVFLGCLGLLLGLSFFLYLPLRFQSSPAFNYAGTYAADGFFRPLPLDTLPGFWLLVSGRSFSNLAFAYPPDELVVEARQFTVDLWRAFAAIGIGPGLLGAVLLFYRNWKAGFLLGFEFSCHVLFFVSYRAADKELMFLPAYLVWGIWLAVGYDWLLAELGQLRAVSGRLFSGLTGMVRSGFVLVIIGVVFWSVISKWQRVDQSQDWSARRLGEEIMSLVEPNAVVFGYWDVIPVLQYLQLVEGQRPELTLVNRFLITKQDLAGWILQEIDRRPIYVDSLVVGLPSSVQAVAEAGLYKLELSQPEGR